ncbi:MAG TPA: hypothetical protein VJ852_07040 [Gemmatimonadaceae bacterium]|nr:hypothetical protein [Gemmatimonadaceae bacterium]
MTDVNKPLRVELVYDRDCPHVALARSMIRAALSDVGTEISWTEWERADKKTPEQLRHYGSPTILVNGRDVVAENESIQTDGKSCRVYADENDGMRGAPRAQLIARAIRAR